MRWYVEQCDDDWEHSYGITIDTVDNPGWTLTIDLADTELAGKPFEPVTSNLDAPDGNPGESWLHCKVEGEKFKAVGGGGDFAKMIEVFRDWVEL